MQAKDIKSVNELKDPEVQLEQLIELYEKNKLSPQDLLEYKRMGLAITPQVINRFALNRSKNTPKISPADEFKLYELAAKEGCWTAKENVATCYLIGSGIKKDIAKGHEIIAEVARHYRSVPSSNPAYLKSRESLSDILQSSLTDLYPMAALDEAPQEELDALSLEDKPPKMLEGKEEKKQPKFNANGFMHLTADLDLYDPHENKQYAKLSQSLILQKLEVKLAKKEEETVLAYVDDAKEEDATEETLRTLKEKHRAAEKKKDEAEKKLDEIKQESKALLHVGETKASARLVQTEQHYFSSRRTKKVETLSLAKKLQARRLDPTNEKKEDKKNVPVTITATAVPARRLITAEISTVDASLNIFDHDPYQWYQNHLGWYTAGTIPDKYLHEIGNKEKVKLGSTEITYAQRTNPHTNHLGDYRMDDLGKYTQIFKQLRKITQGSAKDPNEENEKQLAKYMLRYSKTGETCSLEELQIFNRDLDQSDLDALNRIFYHCFVKEIARRALPVDSALEQSLATAQIRAVKLILKGILKLRDVFAPDAEYGVFTGTDIGSTPEELRNKITKINKLYIKKIYLSVLPQQSKTILMEHPDAVVVPTRKCLHDELKRGYGSGSDTDGEGYDSDTAEKLYPRS